MKREWRRQKLKQGGARHEILAEEGTVLRRADDPTKFTDAIEQATQHVRDFHMVRDARVRCADRTHTHVPLEERLRICRALESVLSRGYATGRIGRAAEIAYRVFCAQTGQPGLEVRAVKSGLFDITLNLFHGHGVVNRDGIVDLFKTVGRAFHRKSPRLRGCDANGVVCDHSFLRVTASNVTAAGRERLLAEIGFEMVPAIVSKS